MTTASRGVARLHRGAELEVHETWAARLARTALLIRVAHLRGGQLGAPALLAAPILLAAVAVLVYLLPGATTLLEYQRDAILQGQPWRLLTGHWTHASLDHLAWDVLAFVVLGSAVAWRSRGLFWRTVLGSVSAISLSLLVLAPHWLTYRGLSGIDSALFAALAAALCLESERRPDRWLGAGALVLFCGKVGFEMVTGSAIFTTHIPGHEVVPLAHFAGACVGLLAAADCRRRRQAQRTMNDTGRSSKSE